MKSDFLPAAPWCSRELGGVDAGGLTSTRGGSMGLESGNQVLNKQEIPFQPDRRRHPVCTGVASWQRTATKHRVEPIQPCFTITLRSSGRSSRLVLCFEPRHFCVLQTRPFPPLPETHSGRKEPSQESNFSRFLPHTRFQQT